MVGVSPVAPATPGTQAPAAETTAVTTGRISGVDASGKLTIGTHPVQRRHRQRRRRIDRLRRSGVRRPLDNDESSFATGIPGDNMDACKQDCFFDGNSGMGDDHLPVAAQVRSSFPEQRAAPTTRPTPHSTPPSARSRPRNRRPASTPAASWCRTAVTASAAVRFRARPTRSAWRRPARPRSSTIRSPARRARRSPSARTPASTARSASASRRCPRIAARSSPTAAARRPAASAAGLPGHVAGLRPGRHRSRGVPRRHRLHHRLLPEPDPVTSSNTQAPTETPVPADPQRETG